MSRDPDSTRVDLGDDLLEPTRTLQVPKKSKQTREPILDFQDLFDSAQIYLNEGFLDDAKKILHKLFVTPEASSIKDRVQRLLDEIQNRELDKILKAKKEKVAPKVEQEPDVEAILKKLESDLEIDEKIPQLKIQIHAADFELKDLIDLAVAFSEMNQLQEAKNTIAQALSRNPLNVDAQCLNAEIHLLLEDYYPAIESLQLALAESEIELKDKVHLMYMMGRLREETKAISEATFWYQQALQIDGAYRDAAERLKRLLR